MNECQCIKFHHSEVITDDCPEHQSRHYRIQILFTIDSTFVDIDRDLENIKVSLNKKPVDFEIDYTEI